MKNSWDWNQALVLDASDRDYLKNVLALLDGAKKEIVIAFYLIEPSAKASVFHPVNELLEGLLRARKPRSLAVPGLSA